jgi:hypothetical protein
MCVHKVNDTMQMNTSQALLIAYTKHVVHTHTIFPPACFGS